MNNPTPTLTPSAEDLDAVRDLPWDILDRAIARLHETEARAERARSLAELDRRLDKWAEHEGGLAVDAKTDLIRAILTTSAEFSGRSTVRPEKHLWPAIGVTMGDRSYLVIPDPYQEGAEHRRNGPDRMMLTIFDRGAIDDITNGDVGARSRARA